MKKIILSCLFAASLMTACNSNNSTAIEAEAVDSVEVVVDSALVVTDSIPACDTLTVAVDTVAPGV